MFCIGCGYALRGLQEHRCPECGRGFDPADPNTFADLVRGVISGRVSRALSRLQWVFVLLTCGAWSMHVNYLVAWMVLGREPVPMADDPKYIAGIGWVHSLAMLWFIAALPSVVVAPFLAAYVGVKSCPRWSWVWLLFRFTLPLAIVVTGFVIARSSPRVGEWFMD